MKKKQSKIAALGYLFKKIPRGMKLTFFIVFVFLMRVSGNTFSQQVKVSLECQNEILSKVFKNLERQTNFFFFFNDKVVDVEQRVSVSVKNVDLDVVLEKILGQRYSWEFVNNLIVVKAREGLPQVNSTIKIVGKVTDEDRLPLPGVTVRVKEAQMGVATDLNGRYMLVLPEMKSITLMFSFVGMENKEIKYTGQDTINVMMKMAKVEVEEVVITGYANVRKESFTGTATTVTREQLLKANSKNVIAALQVFDPSFRIRENSQWGSDPNNLPELNIRGVSSIGVNKSLEYEIEKQTQRTNLKDNPNLPIFILDGFEVDVQKIYDMDMNRIASTTILKDAAATAIYGSRAANGVVVVTTLVPAEGQMRVSYTLNGELQFPDLSDYNLCNAREKLEAERLMGLFDSDDPRSKMAKHLEYLNKLREIDRGVDSDWLAQPLRNVFNNRHSVNLQGGSEFVRYGIDFNYDNNGGVMKDSYRNRLGIGVSLDLRNKRWLQVMNTVSYNQTTSENSPYGNFSTYTSLQPYIPIYDDNGQLLRTLYGGNTNPLWRAKNLSSFDGKTQHRNLVNNLSVNVFILSGLQFKGQFSIVKNDSKSETFQDPRDGELFKGADPKKYGSLSRSITDDYSWNINSMLYYNRQIGAHFINATLGCNMQSTYSESTEMKFEGFQLGGFTNAAYAASQPSKTGINSTKNRLVGFISMLNYSYKDIYLFDASLRIDGSSRFGANKRYATFWATGIGLNLHNYACLKDHWLLNTLKVRGSYGMTGKVNFPSYAAITTYMTDKGAWYYTGVGTDLKYLGNPDLTWETTKTLDVGMNVGLLNNLLFLSGTYYHKKTINLIDNMALQTSSGFKERKSNGGSMLNEGFEINFNSTVYKDKKVTVVINANLASNKNKILELGEASKEYNKKITDFYNKLSDGNYWKMRIYPFVQYREGASTTSIYAVPSAGIDPANGKEKFIRNNGTTTYLWDANDQMPVGDALPEAQGSFAVNVACYGFYLNLSFMYQWGAQTYNQTLLQKVENADIANSNVDKRVLSQRWKKVGDIVPYYDLKKNISTQPSSRFVQDYNYLNFSGFSLGYDFGKEFLQKIRLSSLGVRLNANDLCRWSSVKEERGIGYPYSRNYSFSISLSF